MDAHALADCGFSQQPSPATCCHSRDGWLIATFFQITRLRKSLDGRNGDGVTDCNRNNENCQAEVIPK